ncbi:NifU C-terminal domain-containing protein, AnfU [Azotobacter vinelandii CA]|uniref:NifU C-terminal domain-containing protein, AnfU n=2 Tax=Azotobacter vinelandii TaxID=354 RepID=C1DK97_AZOVD|nr:NifU family protein [Azotobacter vinelandii]ACO81002.1 NifU C-terminal domain-containing protein, AnfU [Azotobacter vinelandii DJ]AGK13262.1 NifU C-terminal domain-containing protein, AnfU [Azotobacter vinelandii CA]AGK17551.1 NifU C-terminal domain-containing protein, AnfU [Azotobacter vinelandii CA6]WKN21786.1 NifU family protein [Azotobacter vinelandii]SFW98567.1 NifU-like domain-containing protein [Azotobacter vinelandii]
MNTQPDLERSAAKPLTEEQRSSIITETIERLRPGLQADGGDMEIVSIDGYKVRLRLKGMCAGCTASGETLGGIRRQLMLALGENEPILVLPELPPL